MEVTTNPHIPGVLKEKKALLIRDQYVSEGFSQYIATKKNKDLLEHAPDNARKTLLGEEFSYLNDGDIIRLSDNQSRIRVLFRRDSQQNSLLITEQCDHYCLMCSQPPKNIDDSWLLDEIHQVIKLMPRDTPEIGITGGEPTLHRHEFLKIIQRLKNYLPDTAVHVLSNGRAFSDAGFSVAYSEIEHPDLMVGIPVYSSTPEIHDYIVQSKGAFDETIRGILNLKKLGQRVEIRVVLHEQTIDGLPLLAEFISRNLLFVDHVALMGLEMTGFTRANIDKLWIDPFDYKDTLSHTIRILSSYGINTSIYNTPLCLINPQDEPFYKKSISDWKNEYAPECNNCSRYQECGGFFSSSLMHGYSAQLRPFTN